MQRISAKAFAERIQQGFETDEIGIDVREPYEWEEEHLPGMLHIPMKEVPQRCTDLNAQKQIYVLCAHGVRSAKVASYLEEQGFERVVNVDGGIAEVKKHLL